MEPTNKHRVSIVLEMAMPAPGSTSAPGQAEEKKPAKRSIEDEVRDSLDLINSGYESKIEFRALRKLYDDLCKMKQTDRIKNLRAMIKPTLSKFGYHVE